MQPAASASNSATTTGSLCPNCTSHLADTPITYDETLFAEFRAASMSRRRRGYSSRSITAYGKTTLCSRCAAAYHRNVALRANGRRLANIGLVVMLVAGVLSLFLSFLSGDARTGIAGLSSAGVVTIGVLTLLTGVGMNIVGRVMRRSAARFVETLKP